MLDAYAQHLATLSITPPVGGNRYRAALRFVHRHRDLIDWMRRPTPQRLVDLRRAKAAAPRGRRAADRV